MKKLFVFAFVALLSIASCTKEGGASSSLSGTNWTYSNDILQFTSKSEVSLTNTKSNTSSKGTYTYSNNKVTFNLVEKTGVIDFVYDYGEVNGNMMTVTYHYGDTKQSRIYQKK